MTKYLELDFDPDSDQLHDVLDELCLWSAPFGLKLLDNILLKKGISVLDIGFCDGFPLTELALRLGQSSTIYGIDPWEAAIRRTKKKISIYNIQNVKIIKGVAENIPLNNNSIDLITSNNGINNVTDLDKTLQECFRILKSGGQFIQTMNLNSTMIEFYEILEKVLQANRMGNELNKMKEQIYKKRKPLDEFLQLLKQHGFSITNVMHDQFDYKFVDGTTLLNHYFIRFAFLSGWKNILPESKQAEIFETIESEMNNIAEINGYFKLSVPFVLIDCTK